MKKLLSIFCILLGSYAYSQTIDINEIDEFTGVRKIYTSWEYLGWKAGYSPKIRIQKIDNTYIIGFKLITGDKVVSVNQGNQLHIKFNDNSLLTFENSEYALSCTGCGSTGFIGSEGQGIELYFYASENDIKDLAEKAISKSRIELNSGYREGGLKARHLRKIQTISKLILESDLSTDQ